jgi:SNF2 family DNA or RNA helicase
MTATAPILPIPAMPNGELYYSPRGLYEFQADGVARCCVQTSGPDGLFVVWDWGLGKSHLAMATAAYLFADNLIDFVMVISEKNKLREWAGDFALFTSLTPHRYHGVGRERRLEKALRAAPGIPVPQVFITSYETGRNELMRYEKTGSRGRGHKVDGPLMTTLRLRGKRILWVFDEPKLRNRGSEIYRTFEYALGALRKGPHHQRVLALTATPIERDIEDAFNIGRIVAPTRMPTVDAFERLCVAERDRYRRARYKPGRVQVFASEYFQPIMLRKRKTDPDVIDQFPRLIEESAPVPLLPEHAKLYEAVEGIYDPPDGEEDTRTRAEAEVQEKTLMTVLRMVAGHPAAVLHSSSELAATIVENVGADRLREIKSSKTEELLAKLNLIVRGQGAQVLVFTFFANTVLPEVRRELEEAGYAVSVYTGGNPDNEEAKRAFKAGETEILLASDAAARGINLENVSYVIEYDSATTYATRAQRAHRGSRLTSENPSLTCITLIAEDTIEEGLVDLMLSRNRSQDTLLGDSADGSAFTTAADRRRLLTVYRNRRRKK